MNLCHEFLNLCVKYPPLSSVLELHRIGKVPQLENRRYVHLLDYMNKRKENPTSVTAQPRKTRIFDAVILNQIRDYKKNS